MAEKQLPEKFLQERQRIFPELIVLVVNTKYHQGCHHLHIFQKVFSFNRSEMQNGPRPEVMVMEI